MKLAVLGIGGLGRTIALELAADPKVTELLLIDRRGGRSRALKSIGRTAAITPIELDVTRADALAGQLRGVDAAVNAVPPDHNLRIMEACLEAGCHYLDCAGLSPVAPGERPGVLEQLGQDEAWKAKGRAALVSLGSDPGLSNIMARVGTDRLASLDEIRVLKGHASGPLTEGYPLYSRSIFLRDAVSPPTVWEEGKLVPKGFVSDEEDYVFPEPLGRRHVYNFYHEEVITLPLRLGRPVSRVCYKHDIRAELVRAIVALDRIDLLDPARRVSVGAAKGTFREAFMSTFPEPSTLVGPMTGAIAIVVEVRGRKADGTAATIRGSSVVEHREANRRRGTTAERFVTAGVVAAGMALLRDGKFPRSGVLAPEELPPEAILPELKARDIPFAIEETAG